MIEKNYYGIIKLYARMINKEEFKDVIFDAVNNGWYKGLYKNFTRFQIQTIKNLESFSIPFSSETIQLINVSENCTLIITNKEVILNCYMKNIAMKNWENGTTFIDPNYYNLSATVGKYRNRFLEEDIRKTRKKLQNGEYVYLNLNF